MLRVPKHFFLDETKLLGGLALSVAPPWENTFSILRSVIKRDCFYK